jgi:hypothetical protein
LSAFAARAYVAAMSVNAGDYRPRAAEHTVLYRVIDEHLDAFLETVRRHADGAPLPDFVEQEFRDFLTCGVLAHGFARLRCTDCELERLVPFSCKGRGFCPSCGGRRMTECAARLVDEVLPRVPVRQWVLSLPYRLRYLLAWDHALARAVLAVSLQALLGFQRARARRYGIRDGRSGSVTVIQRFGYRRSYCDLLHDQSLDRPSSYGSGPSQRSRQALEPRGGVLGDLQPPHLTVRLEIVALAFHQSTLDPSTDYVQLHAEPLGHARHGVASIRVTVGKEHAPRPVGRDAADPLFLPRPPDRPRGPGETSTRPHPFRVEDLRGC